MKVVIKDDYDPDRHPTEEDCDHGYNMAEARAEDEAANLQDLEGSVEIAEVKLQCAAARLEAARANRVYYGKLCDVVNTCQSYEGDVGVHGDVSSDLLNHAVATQEIEEQKHAVNEAMLAASEAEIEYLRKRIDAFECQAEYWRAQREVASELAVLEGVVQTHESEGTVKIGEFS